MIIEITGNELLPVATATIRYASYKAPSAYHNSFHINQLT